VSFEILEPGDAAWGESLARVPHDVYHLPGYARVCETHEPWPVRLAAVTLRGDVLLQPFMLRPLPRDAEGCDVTVPYGYPGPVSSSADPVVQRDLVGGLLDGFRELGAVSVFIRCHPFYGVALPSLETYGEVLVHGEQVYIEPLAVAGPIEASIRTDHRRTVRILRREGFGLRVDAEEDFDVFPALYRENMVRLGADPYYSFPDAYFDAIRTCLADSVHVVTATAPDGGVAAIALVLVCGPIAQYHLSCTTTSLLRMAPSKLSILGMAELCRDLGVEILNLGGGVGGADDSLFQFKAGFSRARAPFATARFVLDRERYETLSEGIDAPPSFFPAYRKGL
jgi:hypothetical protein